MLTRSMVRKAQTRSAEILDELGISNKSRDEADYFTDPRIQRIPEIVED